MKTREPEFFKQYIAVVLGTLLLVMSFAFVAIPWSLNIQTTQSETAPLLNLFA